MIHIANESLLFVFEFSQNKLIFWLCDGVQKQKFDKLSNDSIAPPRGKINSIYLLANYFTHKYTDYNIQNYDSYLEVIESR